MSKLVRLGPRKVFRPQFPNLAAPNEVRIRTIHQVVYLYGQVNTPFERDQAELAAKEVAGVRKVVDTIGLNDAGG